jgi:methionine sulfoxide reductase catalytic subunit
MTDQITDPKLYATRRNLMRAAVLGASTLATGWVYRQLNGPRGGRGFTSRLAKFGPTTAPSSAAMAAAFRSSEPPTSFQDITHYNNYYEFSTDKEGVADAASGFISRPWKVAVGGLVGKPTTFDLDDVLKTGAPEERIYRHRCVEGWSMVIPWAGFSLSKLLDRVQPLSSAKFVAFQTLLDPKRMPNQQSDVLSWPYVEGLRMDEAMHPLTLLASGLYGKELPPQDGAPLRLIVPWKYGFKGIKAIVKIDLVADQPATTWSAYAPSEYGFYSNVNPEVDHPRWSQATERRIDELERRDTLMFNGYADQVASLYNGMDLKKYY